MPQRTKKEIARFYRWGWAQRALGGARPPSPATPPERRPYRPRSGAPPASAARSRTGLARLHSPRGLTTPCSLAPALLGRIRHAGHTAPLRRGRLHRPRSAASARLGGLSCPAPRSPVPAAQAAVAASVDVVADARITGLLQLPGGRKRLLLFHFLKSA